MSKLYPHACPFCGGPAMVLATSVACPRGCPKRPEIPEPRLLTRFVQSYEGPARLHEAPEPFQERVFMARGNVAGEEIYAYAPTAELARADYHEQAVRSLDAWLLRGEPSGLQSGAAISFVGNPPPAGTLMADLLEEARRVARKPRGPIAMTELNAAVRRAVELGPNRALAEAQALVVDEKLSRVEEAENQLEGAGDPDTLDDMRALLLGSPHVVWFDHLDIRWCPNHDGLRIAARKNGLHAYETIDCEGFVRRSDSYRASIAKVALDNLVRSLGGFPS